MTDSVLFRRLREVADYPSFVSIIQSTEDQKKRQRDIEYLMRFLAYRYVPYDGKMDVEEYITSAIIKIAEERMFSPIAEADFKETFDLLYRALESDALKRFSDGKFSGRVGLTALETVAVGVSVNIVPIRSQKEPENFLRQKVKALWDKEDVANFSRAGVTGTQRIQKSIPYGKKWFRPE
jgi:hypothetical protein